MITEIILVISFLSVLYFRFRLGPLYDIGYLEK
jgi:hypothetical protein